MRWMEMLMAAAPGDASATAEFVTDPSFWLNAGALGVIAGMFAAGRLHSPKELDRVERTHVAAVAEVQRLNDAAITRVERNHAEAMAEMRRLHEVTLKAQEKSHADAMQRMDDHVRQLILERDAANEERNKAVGVMRDFTLMAGAVLNQQRPPWGDGPAPPSALGGSH